MIDDMDVEDDQVGLKIPALTDRIDEVYRYVETCMHDAELDGSKMHNIMTACAEIFTNIAKYAYLPNAGDVMLDIVIMPDQVVLEFRDGGRPFNPVAQAPPDLSVPADEREPGGLGIFLVKQMMDEMDYKYESGQNVLRMRKDR